MKLEQVLFGYKGGHRRLAGSGVFQSGDERFLVRMTDLSGSRMQGGFEEYLSGYALPSGSAYVFAKTWYAPECERPGCVWTHAVFIGPNDWDVLGPEEVCSLFKRPDPEHADLEFYATPLQSNSSPLDTCASMPTKRDCAALVEALYTNSLPILWSVEQGGPAFEQLLIQLVWQRPLSLRNTLSFCTGALTFLRGEHDPIRVQLMPARAVRATREDAQKLTSGQESEEYALWVDLLANDLFVHDELLRSTLASYQPPGVALSESNAADSMRKVASLCVAYYQFEAESLSSIEILHTVGEAFPLSSDQVSLKKKVLESVAKMPNGPSDLLHFVTGTGGDAYSELKPVIIDAATLFARENPTAVLNFLGEYLFKPRAGEIADVVIARILASLDVKRLLAIRPVDSQIVYALALQQPNAMADSAFWLLQQSFEESAELADMLKEGLSEDAVLSALLSADRFDLLLRMLRLQGSPGAYKAFRLAQGLRLGAEEEFRKVIALSGEFSGYAQTIAFELRNSPDRCDSAQLFLLSSLNVEPRTLISLVPDIETWLQTLHAIPPRLQRFHAVAFFLACGNEFQEGWKLASHSLDLLHESVANKSLPLEFWSLVKARLPSLSLRERWDKCERLRRGLVDAFLRNGWSSEKLKLCTDNSWLYQKLLDTYRRRAS